MTAGADTYVPGQNPTASETNIQRAPVRVNTLKDAIQAKPEQQSEGKWTAEQVTVETDLLKAELPQGVKELAEVPSKEVLVAKFLGSIQSPIYKFAYAIKSVAEKLEGGDAPAEENAEA